MDSAASLSRLGNPALGEAPRLSAAVKLNFGVGQIAEGIKTCSFSTFLLFYYNQVLGLSGDLAGTAIMLALIFDAVTDPIAGSVSDRWRGPRGRRHPFMYASAAPLGVSFFLLFAPWVQVDEVGQYGLFAWMLLATILTRASMTLYHVPHMALGAELSEDYDQRTGLVAIRHFFGAVGYILVYALGFGVFFTPSPEFPNGQTNPAAYPPYALTLGLIMVASILLTAFGTRSRIPHLPQAQANEKRVRPMDVLREVWLAMQNPSFRWMMLGFIVIIVAFGVATATGIYMYTYFWGLNRFQILIALAAGPVGSMLGYAVARPFFAWLDKRDAMIVGGFCWMVIYALPVLLYLAGWLPPPGSWALANFLTLITVFAGATIAQLIVGIGTAMADIADENELQTGRRQEGVFFGASAFAIKCSAALGSFLAGVVLTLIDWPTGSAVRTADIPPDTLLLLAVLTGPITALAALPGLALLRGYRLNRKQLRDIQAALRTAADA